MVIYLADSVLYATVGILMWRCLNPVHFPASYRKASFVVVVPFWPVILAAVIAIGFNYAGLVLFSRSSGSPVFDQCRSSENAHNPMASGLLRTGTGERRRALGRSNLNNLEILSVTVNRKSLKVVFASDSTR
jgi:hypothetical protein